MFDLEKFYTKCPSCHNPKLDLCLWLELNQQPFYLPVDVYTTTPWNDLLFNLIKCMRNDIIESFGIFIFQCLFLIPEVCLFWDSYSVSDLFKCTLSVQNNQMLLWTQRYLQYLYLEYMSSLITAHVLTHHLFSSRQKLPAQACLCIYCRARQ